MAPSVDRAAVALTIEAYSLELERFTLPGFITKLPHEYVLIIRSNLGTSSPYLVHDTKVLVPGRAELSATFEDRLEPPSTDPVLEIELLVVTSKIDVSLGTVVVDTTYYLGQARDDPSGLSPRFVLTLQRDDEPEEMQARIHLSLGVPIKLPPIQYASTRAYLTAPQPTAEQHAPSLLEGLEGLKAPPVGRAEPPEGFYFDGLDSRINWSKLRESCHVNRIERTGDTAALLSFLPDLAYGDVTDEEAVFDADDYEGKTALLKPLKLAQLSTQYLLFCESQLRKQAKAFKVALAAKEREIGIEERELLGKEAMLARLRSEITATDKLLRGYEDVHRACKPALPLPSTAAETSPPRHERPTINPTVVTTGRGGHTKPPPAQRVAEFGGRRASDLECQEPAFQEKMVGEGASISVAEGQACVEPLEGSSLFSRTPTVTLQSNRDMDHLIVEDLDV